MILFPYSKLIWKNLFQSFFFSFLSLFGLLTLIDLSNQLNLFLKHDMHFSLILLWLVQEQSQRLLPLTWITGWFATLIFFQKRQADLTQLASWGVSSQWFLKHLLIFSFFFGILILLSFESLISFTPTLQISSPAETAFLKKLRQESPQTHEWRSFPEGFSRESQDQIALFLLPSEKRPQLTLLTKKKKEQKKTSEVQKWPKESGSSQMRNTQDLDFSFFENQKPLAPSQIASPSLKHFFSVKEWNQSKGWKASHIQILILKRMLLPIWLLLGALFGFFFQQKISFFFRRR